MTRTEEQTLSELILRSVIARQSIDANKFTNFVAAPLLKPE